MDAKVSDVRGHCLSLSHCSVQTEFGHETTQQRTVLLLNPSVLNSRMRLVNMQIWLRSAQKLKSGGIHKILHYWATEKF